MHAAKTSACVIVHLQRDRFLVDTMLAAAISDNTHGATSLTVHARILYYCNTASRKRDAVSLH
jgi:hypothetical protein